MSKNKKYGVNIQGEEEMADIDEITETFKDELIADEMPVENTEALEAEPEIVEEEPIAEDAPIAEKENEPIAADPVAEILLEFPVASEVQFKWDGRIYPGLFAELMAANLSEAEEEKLVRKLADKGAAIKTVLQGEERVNTERVIDYAINQKVTWDQYKEWKNSLNK